MVALDPFRYPVDGLQLLALLANPPATRQIRDPNLNPSGRMRERITFLLGHTRRLVRTCGRFLIESTRTTQIQNPLCLNLDYTGHWCLAHMILAWHTISAIRTTPVGMWKYDTKNGMDMKSTIGDHKGVSRGKEMYIMQNPPRPRK